MKKHWLVFTNDCFIRQFFKNFRRVSLIEECAEVIQATTKCQRFGFDVDSGVKYGKNDVRLSEEIGDLLGVIEALMPELDAGAIHTKRNNKIVRAEEMLVKYGSPFNL